MILRFPLDDAAGSKTNKIKADTGKPVTIPDKIGNLTFNTEQLPELSTDEGSAVVKPDKTVVEKKEPEETPETGDGKPTVVDN